MLPTFDDRDDINMSDQLQAVLRKPQTRGDLTKLRQQSKIPAVVYGHGAKNQPILLDYRAFEKLYGSSGTSSLVDLAVEGSVKPLKVLISEVQRDPVTHKVIHVDLHQVRMDEKIRTHINLEFVGESPAVKSLGGNLVINTNTLTVECLPQDLISSIAVDISPLSELDQNIHVRDLNVPSGMTVIDSPDGSVVSVLAPRVEKVEVAPAAETVPGEVGAEEGAVAEGEGAAAEPAESPAGSPKEKK